jgi:voltage-gated potassium channel
VTAGGRQRPLDAPPEERERIAEAIADRLDVPMTAAGVVFLLLVVAETVSAPTGAVGTAFTVASWVLWAAFVGEFVLRLVIAPSTAGYLRRNWWQIVFLAVPFLRFLRALRAIRAARMGRVVSSAVRSSRTAGRKLSSRLSTVAVVTLIVVLAASQLLYETGDYGSYASALHASALATMAGEPTGSEDGFTRLIEVALIGYSVVVFAALAGSFGAFLLEREGSTARQEVGGGQP